MGDSNGHNMILALRKPTIQLVTKTCKQLAIKDNKIPNTEKEYETVDTTVLATSAQ